VFVDEAAQAPEPETLVAMAGIVSIGTKVLTKTTPRHI